MARIIRVIKLLGIVVLIKLMLSCCSIFGGCECNNPPIIYSLNVVEISSNNHSGLIGAIPDTDTMFCESVSFSVTLRDTNFYYPYYAYKQVYRGLPGFTSSYAYSDDCDPLFSLNEKIEKVEIITLFQINPSIPLGTDVAELFAAESSNYPNNGLYATLTDVVNYLNTSISNFPNISFEVFLKEKVENSSARFVFNLHLSDGRVLTDTTSLVVILQN